MDSATTATDQLSVSYVAGEAYLVRIREHQLLVDQPFEVGGDDMAPSPVEVFVASLVACVAFYAGRYLTRHGESRQGLEVTAGYELAPDRPARVGAIRIRISAPGLPAERTASLLAVVSHCTVHNSLVRPPQVSIEIA
jgi:uncharacterized OsmC-like protein